MLLVALASPGVARGPTALSAPTFGTSNQNKLFDVGLNTIRKLHASIGEVSSFRVLLLR